MLFSRGISSKVLFLNASVQLSFLKLTKIWFQNRTEGQVPQQIAYFVYKEFDKVTSVDNNLSLNSSFSSHVYLLQ